MSKYKIKDVERLIRKCTLSNHITISEKTKKAVEFVKQGEAKFNTNDYTGAIEAFNKAIEIEPKYISAYIGRIRTKEMMRDFKGALKDYNKIIRIADHIPAFIFFRRGYTKTLLRDFRGAVQDYGKAIKIGPIIASNYLVRGYGRELIGDYRGEISDCNKAIKIKPKYAFAYLNRGRAKALMDNHRGAIRDYNIGISLEQENKDAYDYRGAAKRELGDYKGAIKDFDTAIKLDPGYISAFNNRGFTKYISGDINGAIADYRQIIKNKKQNKSYSINERLRRLLQYSQSQSQQMTNIAARIIPIGNDVRETAQGISRIENSIHSSFTRQKNRKQPWNKTMRELAEEAVKLYNEKQFGSKARACRHLCKIYTFKERKVNYKSLYQLTKGN